MICPDVFGWQSDQAGVVDRLVLLATLLSQRQAKKVEQALITSYCFRRFAFVNSPRACQIRRSRYYSQLKWLLDVNYLLYYFFIFCRVNVQSQQARHQGVAGVIGRKG